MIPVSTGDQEPSAQSDSADTAASSDAPAQTADNSCLLYTSYDDEPEVKKHRKKSDKPEKKKKGGGHGLTIVMLLIKLSPVTAYIRFTPASTNISTICSATFFSIIIGFIFL